MNKANTKSNKPLSEVLVEPIDIQASYLGHLYELGILLVNQILEDAVQQYTGQRYSHSVSGGKDYVRYGYNPSSIKLQGQRHRLQVPRVHSQQEGKFVSLPALQQIRESQGPDSLLLRRLLLGSSTRDYEKIIEEATDSFGVSKSTVSRQFIQEARQAVAAFKNRSLKQDKFVVILLDGKKLRTHQLIIAIGITAKGEKKVLGFVQADTENTKVVRQLLVSLNHRGLQYNDGLLFVIDGAKGLRAAIEQVYGHKAIVQRCVWHKQENVLSYLNEQQRSDYKLQLQHCYRETDYTKARAGLQKIEKQLEVLNPGAARSLQEGMEETLTLQKLKMVRYFRQSLSTTNCIENINRLIEQKTGKIKHWVNGLQVERWLSVSLLDIEPRLNKIQNYKYLHLLTEQLKVITKTKKANQLFLSEDMAIAISSDNRISTKKRA